MGTPKSKGSRIGTPIAEKSVWFSAQVDNSSVRKDTPSHLAEISKIPAVRACPSYNKAVQQLRQCTSFLRISDIGSDRDADQCPTENALRDSLRCLDPSGSQPR